MKIKKTLLVAALSAGLFSATSAHAVLTQYVFDGGTDSVISGWFIYDRDTSTLGDFLITFSHLSYPNATFTSPVATIVSASPNSFQFTDNTTAYGGENMSFDVSLGWPAWTHGPAAAKVDFFSQLIDGNIGQITAPISYVGNNASTRIGGNMQFQQRFYSAGPVSHQQTSPVPEPETYAMLLAGLGLLSFTAKRRKQSA